jgi:hypothetical protein
MAGSSYRDEGHVFAEELISDLRDFDRQVRILETHVKSLGIVSIICITIQRQYWILIDHSWRGGTDGRFSRRLAVK